MCFILISLGGIKICNNAALENASILLTCKLLSTEDIFDSLPHYLTPVLNCVSHLSTHTSLIYSSKLRMCLLFSSAQRYLVVFCFSHQQI